MEVFKEICGTIVSKQHRKMMEKFLDLSTLEERLQDTESIAMEYCSSSGSWHLGRFIVKKRNEKGKVINVLYVVRQIDQQKQQEIEYKQRLLDTAEEARRANIAKTDFLRRMSHDIRTPINGIQGMLAIADHYPDDLEKQKECRDKVKEAAGFLINLVNSILDMNKLESGTTTLEHTPFDLITVLQEVNGVARMNADLRGLTISVDHSKIKHRKLLGSPLHLKQILQNIDGNAIKYNRVGGSIFFSTEEVACEGGKATYKFRCSDTGRGMSKSFLSHVFEPFAQEDSSARTSYMGTGLGMPIAKHLTEMMGGNIAVESELNVGTTFTVTISFELDSDYKEEYMLEEENLSKNLSGLTALLVEDNELNMEIAKFILENAGINVITAKDGKEAVYVFAKSDDHYFDVILMDIMMPVMDGLTATKTIRSLERQDYIEAVAPDNVEMKTAELLSGIDGTMMFRYNSKDTFQTLYVYLSEYQSGKRISHKKVLELSYEDVKSAKNGLIVITPDFDNFTAKLIAADEYSKYMTETPILEGAANREYYGRSATSIENKSPIEYGKEQGLAALIYGEQGVSSLPIQNIKGEYIDTENEYMYYYSVEFVK